MTWLVKDLRPLDQMVDTGLNGIITTTPQSLPRCCAAEPEPQNLSRRI
ncbi:MAG: hypothetical protein ACXWDL_14575 [Nocardioides sp.]